MEVLKVILLAIALFSVAMLGLAVRILLKKGGEFPNTHISGSKHLKKNGVYCYQTQDKLAQREAKKRVNFQKLGLISDNYTEK